MLVAAPLVSVAAWAGSHALPTIRRWQVRPPGVDQPFPAIVAAPLVPVSSWQIDVVRPPRRKQELRFHPPTIVGGVVADDPVPVDKWEIPVTRHFPKRRTPVPVVTEAYPLIITPVTAFPQWDMSVPRQAKREYRQTEPIVVYPLLAPPAPVPVDKWEIPVTRHFPKRKTPVPVVTEAYPLIITPVISFHQWDASVPRVFRRVYSRAESVSVYPLFVLSPGVFDPTVTDEFIIPGGGFDFIVPEHA